MDLSPSAHLDTFCRDHLPPADQWPTLHFDLPELAYPDRLNCAEALLDDTIARLGPDRICLYAPDPAPGRMTAWSYGELQQTADRIAHVLTEDLGLLPGNRVMLRGPNNPWLVACWFGVLKAGGVVVTTMPLLRARELRELADLTRPLIALCDARFGADLAEAKLTGLTTIPYGGSGPEDLSALTERHAGRPFPAVRTAADDVALLAPTSGTTGVPKVTMHFHRDVLANADTFSAHVLKPTPEDVFTGTPPLAFTFGLGGLVVFPMRVGAASVLLEKAGPEQLLAAIEEFPVSVLFTAPTGYRALLASGAAARLGDRPGGGLRRCVSAGEPLPSAVWHAFREATGLRIIDGIGATELLHIFISAADEEIRPGATGKPVPGYRAAVLDAEGEPVPDGTPGRLAVTGPTGCRYLDDPRQREYVHNGWNITGDTYVRDAEGWFHYRARSDDMIISSGYNIAGPEVEQVLLGHPEVLDCGVVGAPDPVRGQVVRAYVIPAEGRVPNEEEAGQLRKELQEFVKQAVAPYKYPRQIEFVAELPRTSTGKLQRFRLREQAAATG